MEKQFQVSTHMNVPQKSIQDEIKRKIGRRVLYCLLLLFFTLTGLTIFDATRAFNHLSKSMKTLGEQVSEFIISQAVIDNQQSIPLQLKEVSEANQVKIQWASNEDPLKTSGMQWLPIFSWEYSMSVTGLDGRYFGNLRLDGSLLKNSPLIYELFVPALFLLFTLLMVLFLLIPLIKNIPEKMFIQPLLSLLALLKDNTAISQNDIIAFSSSIELQQITQRIVALLDTVKSTSETIALTQVTTQLAHDLNNYLMGLHNCIQNTPEIPNQQREQINNYLQDIESMANKVLSKRNNSITEAGLSVAFSDRREYSIINQALKATSIAAIKSSTKGVHLITDIATNLYGAFISIDGMEFRRVLINLMNNAIEALPKSKEIHLALLGNHEYVSIKIMDDGKGIPEAILEKLGKEEVTHGKTNGHGLGVFHAHHMIKKWNGDFRIDSHEGIGTTVVITLPTRSPPTWFMPCLDLSSVRKIVIIDDDQNIHNQWHQKLKDHPLVIQNFYTPDEALDCFSKNPVNTSMFFLVDYQYAGKSTKGIDIIKKLSIASRCLLVTGRSDEDAIMSECEKLGIKLLAKNMIEFLPIT